MTTESKVRQTTIIYLILSFDNQIITYLCGGEYRNKNHKKRPVITGLFYAIYSLLRILLAHFWRTFLLLFQFFDFAF